MKTNEGKKRKVHTADFEASVGLETVRSEGDQRRGRTPARTNRETAVFEGQYRVVLELSDGDTQIKNLPSLRYKTGGTSTFRASLGR